jgi:hypothetical protein
MGVDGGRRMDKTRVVLIGVVGVCAVVQSSAQKDQKVKRSKGQKVKRSKGQRKGVAHLSKKICTRKLPWKKAG